MRRNIEDALKLRYANLKESSSACGRTSKPVFDDDPSHHERAAKDIKIYGVQDIDDMSQDAKSSQTSHQCRQNLD